jgi:hypothetical protein
MNRNRPVRFALGTLAVVLGITGLSSQQMAPKALSLIRNDSTSAVTIECLNGDDWQKVPLDPQKEAQLTGDRIRVATTRQDNAIITIDLPIAGGKKYRLFWNTKTSMWDFSSAH